MLAMTRRVFAAAILTVLLAAPARAQMTQGGETFTLNLRDASVIVLADQVSEITGRTLVLDPALTSTVTVVSAQPMSRDEIWSLFQSILRVRGYVAVRSGPVWEVVSEDEARSSAAPLSAQDTAGDQDVVTRLLPLARLPAEEAVRVLRPLVADEGYIEALSEPNAIIVNDARANVDRIEEIARQLDGPEILETEIIRFSFADAGAVAQAIREVLGSAGTGARLSVDAESNALLVRGTGRDLAEIRGLATELDTAPRPNPANRQRTHVYALKFGDAETVAEIVNATLRGGATDLTNPVADAEAQAAPRAQGEIRPVSVQPSTETNAVVIRGTVAQVDEVTGLIATLDQRRAQVVIEAAIVEVSGDVAQRLGTQLGFSENMPETGFASTSFGNNGDAPLSAVLKALGVPAAGGLASGLTIGGTVDNFGIIVQALSQSTRANLLSTPSITTMDNRPATIVVGQNVPFRTGSFGTDGNTVEPFTTIERRDVGITMQVLPRVTANGIVRLDISQEVSALVNANVQGAADLITNRRLIETTVQARDGGTVVLGGLITDDQQSIDGKVPGLGDIPVLGELFRARRRDETRRTLFVFMRPTVITSQQGMQAVAEQRLQRLRSADADDLPRNLLRPRSVTAIPLEVEGLY